MTLERFIEIITLVPIAVGLVRWLGARMRSRADRRPDLRLLVPSIRHARAVSEALIKEFRKDASSSDLIVYLLNSAVASIMLTVLGLGAFFVGFNGIMSLNTEMIQRLPVDQIRFLPLLAQNVAFLLVGLLYIALAYFSSVPLGVYMRTYVLDRERAVLKRILADSKMKEASELLSNGPVKALPVRDGTSNAV